jgi:hypothetical protein
MNESLKLRPTLAEMSSWDDDNPRLDFLVFGTDGSVQRHQLMRGKSFTIALNWTALDRDKVYVRAMIEGSGVMDGVQLWYNATIQLLERYGTGKGYLNDTQSGSVRPSGLHIKRAEA